MEEKKIEIVSNIEVEIDMEKLMEMRKIVIERMTALKKNDEQLLESDEW